MGIVYLLNNRIKKNIVLCFLLFIFLSYVADYTI